MWLHQYCLPIGQTLHIPILSKLNYPFLKIPQARIQFYGEKNKIKKLEKSETFNRKKYSKECTMKKKNTALKKVQKKR